MASVSIVINVSKGEEKNETTRFYIWVYCVRFVHGVDGVYDWIFGVFSCSQVG